MKLTPPVENKNDPPKFTTQDPATGSGKSAIEPTKLGNAVQSAPL